jgi:1-phosphofructokinase family hexose kinase
LILCVAGNPSVDKLFEVERIELGSTHRPEHFVQVPGGKALNVARAAASLGQAVVVAAIMGGYAGRWLDEELEREGIERRVTWSAGESRSSLSVSDRDTGHLTEFYEAGTPVTAEEWAALEAIVDELLPRAAWIAVTGSLPVGAPEDAYGRLVALARERGVPSALDAQGPALANSVNEHPDLVKINAHEAEELLGEPVAGVDDAHRAALQIRERAGGEGHAVVVTLGADGAVLVEPDGTAVQGRLSAKGRYPVGSGDSFLAGLICGLERGATWQDAMGLALGTAAANAEVPGAGCLDPERASSLAAANPGHVLLSE